MGEPLFEQRQKPIPDGGAAVDFLAAPLYPVLSRLVEKETDEAEAHAAPAPEKEEATKDAEVRALLDVAREEGLLEKHEEELVTRAVDFGDRTVGEVMTSRPDIVFAEADAVSSEGVRENDITARVHVSARDPQDLLRVLQIPRVGKFP